MDDVVTNMHEQALQERVSFFRENGVVLCAGLLPPALVGRCLEALLEYTDASKPLAAKDIVIDDLPSGEKGIKYFQHIHTYIPEFYKLFDSRILSTAAELLGQSVYFLGQGLHNKIPGGGTYTPGHQDNFYWCLSPADAVTAYIPLEPQDQENGGVSYARGSHLGDTLPHERSKVAAFSSYIPNFREEEHSVFNPPLEVGDVTFHHANVIHFAKANLSRRHRRAIAITIYGEHAKLSQSMHERYERHRLFNRGEQS